MEQTKNNEVLELLPISIVNSNNFSPKCKFLIATLLFLNGLDKVKNDGYFFRTNQTLAKEANMTEANLLINLRKLESLNFISRKAGKRKEASEYVIYENTINSYVEIPMKVKKYAIAKSNNNTINNSNKDMKEINIETPTGFIQFINMQFENNKITKEEYKREIDFYKKNYYSTYSTIKQLILPIAA